jgi:hypothetical protein
MIVKVMIMEIGFIHLFPVNETNGFALLKCFDRSCTLNKRKSKKLVQEDYENLYTGSVFDLDYRLAQVVVIVWHTF